MRARKNIYSSIEQTKEKAKQAWEKELRKIEIEDPNLDNIKVLKKGKVRRAKLYYLRDRKGKSARISERIKKSIGIDISKQTNEIETVKETVVTESKPTVELKKENTIKDKNIAPKAELKKKELKTKKK